MKLTDAIRGLGRPVAYYPELARFLGSIDAAIFFAQLFYWQDKAAHEYQYQTGSKLEKETGLNLREQRRARRLLEAMGVLKVKPAPLQHETHYTIFEDEFNRLWDEWTQDGKPDQLKLGRRKVSPLRDSLGKFRTKPSHVTEDRTSAIRHSERPKNAVRENHDKAAHPRDYPEISPREYSKHPPSNSPPGEDVDFGERRIGAQRRIQ